MYLKSSRGVDNYQEIQYFKDSRDKREFARQRILEKQEYADKINRFLEDNEYSQRPMYKRVEQDLIYSTDKCDLYVVQATYTSPAGRSTHAKTITYSMNYIDNLLSDPSLLMTKSEYNQYVKVKNKELLEQKQKDLYGKVNKVIDYANNYRDKLIIRSDRDELDRQISMLIDRTVNSIKKIKDIESDEWEILDKYIKSISGDVQKIVQRSYQIYEYYKSPEFDQIKYTCDSLMEYQREFNEYINEKAQAIATLFGTRVTRSETVIDDEFNYIRPYTKSITPYTAEVSAQVFSSAENNPIEYVIKYFYPNKDLYHEQIQKLQTLIEELETLREAKVIIDNTKKDYQAYIAGVPDFVMHYDEDGFYSRLGFANISEDILTVEYRFSYTSSGGMAQRYFTVPMTEETIIELINALQNKLTITAFAKEQRALMTKALRQYIKERDNFTCTYCGNSVYNEPNLLLEIDHIVPVSKGGFTEESNLQTLCWKCNRSKSNKMAM